MKKTESPVIRIMEIELKNFKCVGNGTIKFSEFNSRLKFNKSDNKWEFNSDKPALLGIFGPNGSGKSSAIEALAILKRLMKGEPFPQDCIDCVAQGKKYAELTFALGLCYPREDKSEQEGSSNKAEYYFRKAKYSFCIRESLNNEGAEIFNEKFWLFWEVGEGSEKKKWRESWDPIIDTTVDEEEKDRTDSYPFYTKAQRRRFVGEHPRKLADLKSFLDRAREESRSFVFSSEILEFLTEASNKLEEKASMRSADKKSSAWIEWGDLITFFESAKKDPSLREVFFRILAKGDSRSSKLLSEVWEKDESPEKNEFQKYMCYLNKKQFTDKYQYQKDNNETSIPLLEVLRELRDYASNRLYVEDANLLGGVLCEDEIREKADKINEVLTSISGSEINSTDGSELNICHDKVDSCPLKCESEGIKKLISVLNLFVRVRDDLRTTVAIDNFGDGIFEYSVGKIIEQFIQYENRNKSERGQFIFTSHNFRPLDVEGAEKGYFYFTKSDKNERYQDYGYLGDKKNIVKTNNLRDKYLKKIVDPEGKKDQQNQSPEN